MIALPTGRGWLLVVLTLVSVAIAIVNVGFATAMVSAAFAGILVSSFILAQFSVYFLRVERKAHGDGFCDKELTLPLRVTNRTFFFRQSAVIVERCEFVMGGNLHAIIPPLGPFESITLDRASVAVKRGYYNLNLIRVIGGDPAGLFKKVRRVRIPSELQIYPKAIKLDQLDLLQRGAPMASFEGRPIGQSGSGEDFFGLRPYRSGDEIRFIHWKAVAKKQELMIREFEANTVDRVVILLDTNKELIGTDIVENNFEYLVTLVATLVEHLKEMYCQVYFFAGTENGGIMEVIGDSSSVSSRLLRALMLLHPTENLFHEVMHEVELRIPRGALVYMLSFQENEENAAVVENLMDMHCRINWVVAPKTNFPLISADEPRVIHAGKTRATKEWVVTPHVVSFSTRVEKVLSR